MAARFELAEFIRLVGELWRIRGFGRIGKLRVVGLVLSTPTAAERAAEQFRRGAQ